MPLWNYFRAATFLNMTNKSNSIGLFSITTLCVLILLQLGCSTSNVSHTNKSKKIKELHFTLGNTMTEEGRNSLDSLQDAMVAKMIREQPDKAEFANAMPPGFLSSMMATSNPRPFIISIGDSIWKSNLTESKYSYHYDTTEQNKYIYPNRKLPYTIVRSYIEFDSTRLISYQEYSKERRMISGFDCFKVRLVIKDTPRSESSGFDMGDDIIEMYVTEEINLPMEMVLNRQIPNKNYFPLRVKSWNACCKGLDETTSLTNIIYKE